MTSDDERVTLDDERVTLSELVYAPPAAIVAAVHGLAIETQIDWDVLADLILPDRTGPVLLDRDRKQEALRMLWLAVILDRFDAFHNHQARRDVQARFGDACSALNVSWPEVVRLLPRVPAIRQALFMRDQPPGQRRGHQGKAG